MHPVIRMAAAFAVAFAALTIHSLALPERVLACSCAWPPPSLAEVAARDQVSVIVGTVGQSLPDRTAIGVETWFHGAFPADVVWLTGGTNMASSCDLPLAVGQRWVLVLNGGPAAPGAGGLYSAGSCDPHGELGTPQGNAVLADVIATFGSGESPDPPEAEPPPPIDVSRWLGGGLVWVAAASGTGVLVLAAIVLAARRRRAG